MEYSVFANEVYKGVKNASKVLNGYTLDIKLSNDNNLVYYNKNFVILCIRGTDPTDSRDLISDAMLMVGFNKATPHFKDSAKILDKAYKKYKGYKIIVTGHSLAGRITIDLLDVYPNKIYKVYAFNPGTSPHNLVKHFGKSFVGLFSKSVRNSAKKLNIYTTLGDPISTLSMLEGAKVVKPTSKNPHGLENFDQLKKPMKRSIVKPTEQIITQQVLDRYNDPNIKQIDPSKTILKDAQIIPSNTNIEQQIQTPIQDNNNVVVDNNNVVDNNVVVDNINGSSLISKRDVENILKNKGRSKKKPILASIEQPIQQLQEIDVTGGRLNGKAINKKDVILMLKTIGIKRQGGYSKLLKQEVLTHLKNNAIHDQLTNRLIMKNKQ